MSNIVPGSQPRQCALYAIIVTGQPPDCPHGTTVRSTSNGPILLDHVLRLARAYTPKMHSVNGSSAQLHTELDETRRELEVQTQQLEMRKQEVQILQNKLRVLNRESRRRDREVYDASDKDNTSGRNGKRAYELSRLESGVSPSQLVSSSSPINVPSAMPLQQLSMSTVAVPQMPMQEMAMKRIAQQQVQSAIISNGLPNSRPPPSYSSAVNALCAPETTVVNNTSPQPLPQMPKLPPLVMNEISSNDSPLALPRVKENTAEFVASSSPAEVDVSISTALNEGNGHFDMENEKEKEEEKLILEGVRAQEGVGIRRNVATASVFPQYLVNQNHGAVVFCHRCRLFLPPHPVSVANHLRSESHQQSQRRSGFPDSTYTQFGKIVQRMPSFIEPATVVTEEQRRAESAGGNAFFDNGLDIVKSICSLCEETVTTQSYKVHESLATHRRRVAEARQGPTS